MTTVTIVLDERGVFDKILSNDEIECHVFRRGIDDKSIDEAEEELPEVDTNREPA